ncbi:MAG: hypothetical protein AB1757_05010 [Acidobacteriota bacterium]
MPRIAADVREDTAIPSQILEAIKSGKAPHSAKLAGAKGLFPLSNDEMFEVLVLLMADADEEIRLTAATTVDKFDPQSFAHLAADQEAAPEVLGFFCVWKKTPSEILEQIIFNRATPNLALARLAGTTRDAQILEAISLKQQNLIQTPEIIEAILNNPARTPEAERRAKEIREEFFEKAFGIQMIAEEKRVKADAEEQTRKANESILIGGLEDLVRLGLVEEGIEEEVYEGIIKEYEEEVGDLDAAPVIEYDQIDLESIIGQVLDDENAAAEISQSHISVDRKAMFQQIAIMSVKERVMLAIKGTREARMILIRDPNRIVACAVLRNPRITENEVEGIAAIRTVPEDVLRQIGQNRAYTKSYVVIHNLVRNPRTPVALSLNFLNRIQTRDMRALAANKNIPDVVRTMASRMYLKRSGS